MGADVMAIINVRYSPGFNPDLDDDIEKVVGSPSQSSGFYLPTNERDLQFEVPESRAEGIKARLRAMGVSAE